MKQEKLEAVRLYACGLSFWTITKLLKVSTQSVFVWAKNVAENNSSKPAPIDDSVVIELDEMWHFSLKKDKFGFGKPTVEPQSSLSIGNAEHKTLKRLENCTSD